MPPKPLIDLSELDLDQVVAGPEDIRACNQQRFEMEQLHGILHLDVDQGVAVGYRDIGDDEFWVRGHVPGRPLFPGVLMCESAAQLCSYLFVKRLAEDRFMGFAGMQDVKFRRTVVPGDRLIIVAKVERFTSRSSTYKCQSYVDGKLAFEATIVGMLV